MSNETFENYIEINDDLTLSLEDWIYDGIVNRIIMVLEEDFAYELANTFQETKRESSGFLSLLHLDVKEYKIIIRYIRKALYKAKAGGTNVYIKKNRRIFLEAFESLVRALFSDPRFVDNPID